MVKEGWSCGVLSGPESFCTVQFWELSACLDRHLVPWLIKISLLLERKRGASAKGLGGVAWWRLGPPAGECPSIWDPGRESRVVKTCEVKVAQSWPTLRPRGVYSPWNSPGQDTGVGSLFQRIFPTQGSNPGLAHCRQILYPLSHQGSLVKTWLGCGSLLLR